MLHQRSYEKELLDGDNLSFAEIRQNMEELDVINNRLGGHRITIKGLQAFVLQMPEDEPLEVVEIGCGGGDNLRVIKQWGAAVKQPVQLTGVDINEDCITYACSRSENAGIQFIHSDYRTAVLARKPHIIFSSLFCHHFTNPEIVSMLKWMHHNAKAGFFINDLHRHLLPLFSIRILTTLFSKSRLVKHDAPLSVQRGFTRKELSGLMTEAGLAPYTITWGWAFRWLLIYQKQ
ncbi:MAG TPA: methyltransferase domain-containing protein [Flavisolibacter sp.]